MVCHRMHFSNSVAQPDLGRFSFGNRNKQSSILSIEILSCSLGMLELDLRNVLGRERVAPCKNHYPPLILHYIGQLTRIKQRKYISVSTNISMSIVNS